ncbi:uncharacterized protein LOC123317662 [Coccinella septempunctata]|uniref:uncharacterized protein LOC123317662 n=1 Tax=Coccinella septempunctata TaxID=41139 RepID=UPI001D05D7BE|nr:uncharacterized protein LOC123317662 [Coccinella septempunctata]
MLHPKSAKNKMTAINTWAIPAFIYTAGVLTWSRTDLERLDRRTRTTLTQYGLLHPNSAIERLYIPRRESGRGLSSLENVYLKEESRIKTFFLQSNLPVHHLQQPEVDLPSTNTYLTQGYLYLQTEGTLMAIQDQVVPTRAYAKHIMKQNIENTKCRLCNNVEETVQHLSSGCSTIANTKYLSRHNNMGKVVHQFMCLRERLLQEFVPHHIYEPTAVRENQDIKIYWDLTVQTDPGAEHNRPVMVVWNKNKKSAIIIDFAVPLDQNLAKAYGEKIAKYELLSRQMKRTFELEKALGNRIRRYNERTKRYKNNNLFYKDQKQFFRTLEAGDEGEIGHLEPDKAHSFWTEVWSRESTHDDNAYWIEEAQQEIPIQPMDEINLRQSDIPEILRGSNNWASPGPDKLHNYWWKYFNNVHEKLALLLQNAINNPTLLPGFLTQGVTYLIPKDGDKKDPKNYRPITCLSSVYKILTGVLTKYISRHIREHNLMTEEQGGCREKTKGCKELLVIDHIVTKQARKKLRNISVAWVDYKKAFDSVPHTWLLKVLEMHGIAGKVIELLGHLMKNWRTSLFVRSGDVLAETEQIKINRGIFQGDTLSPIWFCLALNPLSIILNNTNYGYVINKNRQVTISHRLYMDDLKLYGANSEQLRRMLEIVSAFSESVGMEMGVEKCAVLDVRRGKIEDTTEGVSLMNNITIPALDKEVPYKYLGIKQALEIKTPEMKESFKEKLLARIVLLLRAKLNSKALFMAINIWAIPIMAYSFGVLNWSTTELRALDRDVRSILTKYGVHHPHSSTIRLYLPRHQGGRGLLSLEAVHGKNISDLRQHFLKRNSPMFRAIREADQRLSPLKLSDSEYQVPQPSAEDLIAEWSAKALHGRYPSHLKSREVEKVESLTYLRAGYLFPETEGRLLAIQDQVVPTRTYMKHIAKQEVPSDRCRKCAEAAESLQHITSSCPILAPVEYLGRHDAMGRIYHQQIALKLGLLKDEVEQHLYMPKTILENQCHKIYWDATLVTDRGAAHNRPDIAIFDWERKTCLLLDFTVPADDNLARAYTEKITKYADLAFQLREMYKLKSVNVLPMIISVNGLVEKHLPENTKRLCLDRNVISGSQKQIILSTTRIVRKFLQGP